MAPSVSERQANLMKAVAKDPSFAAKVNIPQAVGQEFYAEDKKKAETTKSKVKKRYGKK